MQPLKTNQQVLTWLCIYPIDKSSSKQMACEYIIFSWIIFTLNLCAFVSPVQFIIKFVSTDLESCVFALFQVSATANVVYMTIIAFLLREKITAIFTGLSIIYAASENLYR